MFVIRFKLKRKKDWRKFGKNFYNCWGDGYIGVYYIFILYMIKNINEINDVYGWS